jgi:carbonic anhydrase/acetyltransferase-like protein (isoleucine patch superfamily)
MIYPFPNTTWQRWYELYPELKGTGHFVAEGARLVGDIQIESDSSVWFNAVLRGDNASIRIGKGSNIQDGSTVHTDTDFPVSIGDYVTIGHHAMIHGCTIEHHALIGMGAIIMNGAHIEPHSLIAAGALLPEGFHVPEGSLVVGSPAKIRRPLTHEERLKLEQSALHYVEHARRYRQLLSLTQ